MKIACLTQMRLWEGELLLTYLMRTNAKVVDATSKNTGKNGSTISQRAD